jgi:aminoglycoside phosphotransferase (APT) family kinase protein/anti-sigma regulatory factor (Ser/Thr protein kinase)
MIDIDATLEDMLAGIGWQAEARHVSVSDPADRRLENMTQFHLASEWFPTDADITVGPGRLYLKRFPAASFESIYADLVRPLQAGAGNAVKRGNGNDPSKPVLLEHYFTNEGVVVSITDEGDGFDYRKICSLFQEGVRYGTHNGGGLKLFDGCASRITYENGGRTLLVQFRADMASPATPADERLERLERVDDLYKLMKKTPHLFFVAKCAPALLNAFWTADDFIETYVHPALPTPYHASHDELANSAQLEDTNKQAITIQYALDRRAIVAKFFRQGEQAAQVHEILQAAAESGLGADRPCQVPQPLAYYPDGRLLLTTGVEGIALNRLLTGDIDDLVRGCERAARWLLDFHATPLGGNAGREFERESFRLDRGEDTACSELLREFGADLENRARILRSADPIVVPTHGDFRAESVLLNGDATGVINFDRCKPGEPAADLATFAFHLWKRTFKDTGAWQRAEIAAQAFLAAYAAGKPENLAGVAYYWNSLVLKSLERYARRPGAAESMDHFIRFHVAEFEFACRCEKTMARPAKVFVESNS